MWICFSGERNLGHISCSEEPWIWLHCIFFVLQFSVLSLNLFCYLTNQVKKLEENKFCKTLWLGLMSVVFITNLNSRIIRNVFAPATTASFMTAMKQVSWSTFFLVMTGRLTNGEEVMYCFPVFQCQCTFRF